MNRSVHFRHFVAASSPPQQPLPETLDQLDLPGIQVAVHHGASHALAQDEQGWAWVVGTVVHDGIEVDMEGLATRLLHASDPLSETEHWCGAFSAIRYTAESAWVYHDAGGTHKVFYRKLDHGGGCVGSDPRLLQYWAPLQPIVDVKLREFQESDWLRRRHTRQGNRTWFEGTFQLMPNHSLDLKTWTEVRTFPRVERQPMGLEAVVSEVSERLQFVMGQWLRNRRVHVGLSAGWDSRIVLAACSQERTRLSTYSTLISGMSPSHPDITVPKRMAESLGFHHQVVAPCTEMPKELAPILNGTFDRWYPEWILPRLGWFKDYDPEVLAITGVTSEIAKNYLENAPIRTPLQATRAVHFAEHPWMMEYYEHWLSNDAVHVEAMGYEVKDFMHWEQDACNVAGASIHAFNFVVDSVTPFSSHHILKTLLAASPALRDKHNSRLYRALVESMWPELLDFPVNPMLRDQTILWAKKCGVYWPYKYLHSRYKSRPFPG